MATPRWLERVEQALRRQRLPHHYIQRLIDELADHAADYLLEHESMDAEQELEARLGSPTELAATAQAQWRQRTFAGRHPLITFIGGPIIAVVGLLAASAVLALAGFTFFDWAAGRSVDSEVYAPSTPLEMAFIHAVNTLARFLPFTLAAWWFASLGRTSGRMGWGIAALCLATAAALAFVAIVTPGTDQHPGVWSVGFQLPLTFGQFLQAAAPLAIGVWACFHTRQSAVELQAA